MLEAKTFNHHAVDEQKKIDQAIEQWLQHQVVFIEEVGEVVALMSLLVLAGHTIHIREDFVGVKLILQTVPERKEREAFITKANARHILRQAILKGKLDTTSDGLVRSRIDTRNRRGRKVIDYPVKPRQALEAEKQPVTEEVSAIINNWVNQFTYELSLEGLAGQYGVPNSAICRLFLKSYTSAYQYVSRLNIKHYNARQDLISRRDLHPNTNIYVASDAVIILTKAYEDCLIDIEALTANTPTSTI